MARCSSCSAPLPADTSRCRYCGTRNDMDFSVTNRFAASGEVSGRQCPHCRTSLEVIRLTLDGTFAIERCKTCFGLFFDPGEVQAFLEASVGPAFEINFKELVSIKSERTDPNRQVRYIKCPDCGKFMNRINLGYRSGVVMDQCKQHGIWLDNGELIQLMEWKKAGGQLLDEQQKAERLKEEQRKARAATAKASGSGFITFNSQTDDAPQDLAQAALALISRLFK